MMVVFISTSIPPRAESHTIYNVMLLDALASAGHEVKVITPAWRDENSFLETLMPQSVDVIRTRVPPLEGWLRRVVSVTRSRRLSSVARVVGGFLAVPDITWRWDREVVAIADSNMLDNRPHVVMSSSGGLTAHLAAYAISRRLSAPWVAIYGDPWSLNPLLPARLPYLRYANSRIERRVIGRARLVVFTTEETMLAYKRWLRVQSPEFAVIPVGYNEALLRPYRQSMAQTNRNEFVIRYVGSAYRASRDLRPFLKAAEHFSRLVSADANVVVELVGGLSRHFSRALSSVNCTVRVTGWVDYLDSLGYIASSSLLLLVGNKGALQVPGKVYTYLASGRPILYVGQQPQDRDPTWRMVKQFGGIVFSENSSTSILSGLRAAWSNYARLEYEAQQRTADATLKTWEWGSLQRRFLDLITGLVDAYEDRAGRDTPW